MTTASATAPAPSALEVAKWMKGVTDSKGELYQDDAADYIAKHYPNFIYENEAGNPAIDKKVLAAFKSLTPDLVWERGERRWRRREKTDQPGRMQD